MLMITSNYTTNERAKFYIRKYGNNAVKQAEEILAVNCYKNYWRAVIRLIKKIQEETK